MLGGEKLDLASAGKPETLGEIAGTATVEEPWTSVSVTL